MCPKHFPQRFDGAVSALEYLEVTLGDGSGNFNPFAFVTRAQMASLLTRTFGYFDIA